MRWLLGLTLLLVSSTAAHAALFICGDATTFRGHGFFDPSQPPTCPAPYGLSQVPKGETDAQLRLIEAFTAQKYYLKVVGVAPNGLVTEKEPVEKAEADAAILAKQEEQQAYDDAATNNDLCNASLDELRTRKTQLDAALQGDIDGITNIATAKTELSDMMARLTASLLKLMECIRGRAGPPATP